jgi:colanic acid biosynthesis glycosyl transferase WcaI
MSNVLITGINYWPEPTGIAPYTTELAEHLVEVGHRVWVITGVPHYPRWSVEPEYARGPYEQTRGGVRIIRRRHHVPSRQSALSRGRYESSFLRRGLTTKLPERPEVVIGVSPSLSGAILARSFATRYGTPYGVIVQDLLGRATEQTGIRGGKMVRRLTQRIERWSLTNALAIAAVSESFFPYLQGLGVPAHRLMHVPNWTHIVASTADRSETRRRLGWDEAMPIVLHAGNMGLKQGLDQVIDAARLAADRGDATRFVLMGDGNQRASLERQARGIPTLRFMDVQPAEAYPDVLAAADLLLVSERPAITDMALPSKLTSYFAAGRPVLAAVSSKGATAREVRRSGGGIVVRAGDVSALLAAVEQLATDRALSLRLAAAGRAYATRELSREAALTRADSFVRALIPGIAAAIETRVMARPLKRTGW